jgi:Protein of unknown function (DUF1360)
MGFGNSRVRQTASAMPEPRPPYESYATIMAAFAGLLVTGGALSRRFGRDPQCNSPLDAVLLAAATFKAARTLARDAVTAPLRQPFVEGEAHKGEGEEPVQGGMQQAVGELVTCTRCIGTWVAAALATTQVVAPKFGRLLTLALGTAGANDFLQAAFVTLNRKSDELKARGEG